MNDLLTKYNKQLERKKRLISPLIEKKNSIEGFDNDQLQEIRYNILYAEINMIEKFLEDLIDKN